MDLKQHIRGIADFPKPGILFYDISTLLAHPQAWHATVGRQQFRWCIARVIEHEQSYQRMRSQRSVDRITTPEQSIRIAAASATTAVAAAATLCLLTVATTKGDAIRLLRLAQGGDLRRSQDDVLDNITLYWLTILRCWRAKP